MGNYDPIKPTNGIITPKKSNLTSYLGSYYRGAHINLKETDMTHIAVLYYSGYGHTHVLANTLVESARKERDTEVSEIAISPTGDLTEDQWRALLAADGILMGSPTYMGSVAWQFKKIADESSSVWAKQQWKDKLAGGFTNSASMNGDKDSTIAYLKTFAAQHAMLWVGLDDLPANTKASQRNDINYLGGFSGLLAQSPSDASPEEGPLPGDLSTANAYAKRFVNLVKRWNHIPS
jgi:NAD(P)H dehydrogenase (quinone)